MKSEPEIRAVCRELAGMAWKFPATIAKPVDEDLKTAFADVIFFMVHAGQALLKESVTVPAVEPIIEDD